MTRALLTLIALLTTGCGWAPDNLVVHGTGPLAVGQTHRVTASDHCPDGGLFKPHLIYWCFDDDVTLHGAQALPEGQAEVLGLDPRARERPSIRVKVLRPGTCDVYASGTVGSSRMNDRQGFEAQRVERISIRRAEPKAPLRVGKANEVTVYVQGAKRTLMPGDEPLLRGGPGKVRCDLAQGYRQTCYLTPDRRRRFIVTSPVLRGFEQAFEAR